MSAAGVKVSYCDQPPVLFVLLVVSLCHTSPVSSWRAMIETFFRRAGSPELEVANCHLIVLDDPSPVS